MEKLSLRKRLNIIHQYLEGMSYDEIATRSGVSKGSVANIITELKAGQILDIQGPAQQLDALRELSADLRRHHLTLGEAIVGISTFARLQELDVEPPDIQSWAAIFRELAPNESELKAFTHAALALQDIMKRTGLSFEALEEKAGALEKEVDRLEPVTEELRKCPQEIEELKKSKQMLVNEVDRLEKRYEPLRGSVTQLERREKTLTHRVSGLEEKAQDADEKIASARRDQKALAELGISPDELPGLVNRLAGIAQRHGIGSGELRDRLLNELEVLEAGLGLESSLESKREDLDEIECAIETARQEREALEHALQQLGDQQTALRKSISEEEKHIREEMEAITGIATGAVEKLVQDLEASVADAQLEMEKLRDASIELGQEMGKTEATIQANEWIRDLFALVNRDGTADASRIRVVTLSLMRSVNSWLDENQKDIEVPFWFRTQVNSMIQELLKWKV